MRTHVMGTDAEVIVPGDAALERWAIDRLRDLERRWSRFDPDSEISAVNRAGGEPVRISPETHLVLAAALDAWTSTGGLFDPTVLDCLVAVGYDRTFDDVADLAPPVRTVAAPGCRGVELTPEEVRVPPRVRIDVGGIGKGVAADLVAAELVERGAAGVCVNVGGDLRVTGTGPTAAGWIIGVADPFVEGRELLRLALADGAVATSSRLRRTWRRGGELLHHIVDPATGRPTDGPVAAATVIAARASDADVLAKLVFLDLAVAIVSLRDANASAVVIDESRSVRCIGDVGAFAA